MASSSEQRPPDEAGEIRQRLARNAHLLTSAERAELKAILDGALSRLPPPSEQTPPEPRD